MVGEGDEEGWVWGVLVDGLLDKSGLLLRTDRADDVEGSMMGD